MENDYAQEKAEFLEWLERFAHIPADFRRIIENHRFIPAEYDSFRRQIVTKYRLKAEWKKKRGRSA